MLSESLFKKAKGTKLGWHHSHYLLILKKSILKVHQKIIKRSLLLFETLVLQDQLHDTQTICALKLYLILISIKLHQNSMIYKTN